MEEKIATPKVSPSAPQTSVDSPVEPAKVDSESKTDKVVEDTPEEKKEVDVESLIPSDPYQLDPLFYDIANYFGLEGQRDFEDSKFKLSEIVDYIIRDIKSNKPDDVLLKLREIENSIQPAAWEEKRYKNVYKYIRLAQKKTTVTRAMKAFEREETSV